MNFTPGPWELDEEAKFGNVYCNDAAGSAVAQCDFSSMLVRRGRKEIEANAQLIAAAPDLLDALRHLVHLHTCEQEGVESGMPSPQEWMAGVDKATMALIKAIGEIPPYIIPE